MLDFSAYKHGNECLTVFCQADMPLELETLKEKMGLSRRSLMYLFKHLNEELQGQGLPGICNLKGQGYIISPEAKNFLQQRQAEAPGLVRLTEPEQWRFSLRELREEESLILLTFVIITRPSTSLRELSDIFQGARNTLLRLLGRLPEFLSGSGLAVQVTAKGRCMQGEEKDCRKWGLENMGALLRIFRRFGLQPGEGFLEELRTYEQESGNRFTQDTRQLLAVYLPWYAARLESGCRLAAGGKRGQEQDPASHWARNFLAERGVASAAEEGYLLEVLSFFAFSKVNHHENYEDLHRIAEEMTEQFFGLSGFEPGSNHLLMIDSLAVHLVSAWHRLTAGVNYHNPMLEQIKSRYQNLFVISKAASRPFAEYLGRELPEDELALLTTYFGSDIRMEELEGEKRQILVVCSSGIGTSQFLLMQLREKYPRLLFSGPFRVSELGSLSMREAGLILTTTELGELAPPRIPLCQISPLPDKYEWEMLEQRLLSLGFETGEYSREKVEQLLDIIAGFARIQDEEGLRQSLQQYFRDASLRGRARGTAAASLLKYAEVFPHYQADWRQAVRLSFRSLVAHHFVEERYVERIIELTEKQGEYMLLGRGILLAHARPEDGVLEPAASVAVFAAGVKLASGREVRCMICLAPADKSSHLDFLTALLEHIHRPGWCEALCGAGSLSKLDAVLEDLW